MQPLVSIVIPTYNRADLLGSTLDSLIQQTWLNWECLIVDDGSKDYTRELVSLYLERDDRFIYCKRPHELPKGGNTCRNFGFEKSKGDYINWFDSDDVMFPDFIESKVSCFNKDIDLVICSGFYTDERLNEIKKLPVDAESSLFKDLILGKQIIITNSVMFKRSFLENRTLFCPRVNRGEETEFFSRIFFEIEHGVYTVLDKQLFLYRQHLGTKTNRNNTYNKSYKESLSFIAIQNLGKCLQLQDRELIQYYYKYLMGLFFQGLENDHFKNSRYIFEEFRPYLKSLNNRLYIEFSLIGKILLGMKRSSYRLGKRYREAKIFN